MEFVNPFPGKNPGDQITKQELISAIRLSICAEEEATHLYDLIAEYADDERVKKLMKDVADEEQIHIGEFQKLLEMIEEDEEEKNQEGKDEATKKIGGEEPQEGPAPEETQEEPEKEEPEEMEPEEEETEQEEVEENTQRPMAVILEELLYEVDWKGTLSKIGSFITGRGSKGTQRGETKTLTKETWLAIKQAQPTLFNKAANTPYEGQTLRTDADKKIMISFAMVLDMLFNATANIEGVTQLHDFCKNTLEQSQKEKDPTLRASRLSVVRNKFIDIKSDLEQVRTLGGSPRESNEISIIASKITEDINTNNGLII